MTIENGLPTESGGSGGGGSGAIDLTWNLAKALDYSAQSDTAMATDTTYTIDGIDHVLANVANATGVNYGSSYGGLEIEVPVATNRIYYATASPTAPYVWTALGQYLEGTDAEDLNTVDLSVRWRLGYTGTFGANSEGLLSGIMPKVYVDGNTYYLTYLGGFSGTAQTWRGEIPGTLNSGYETGYTSGGTPPLTYTPNCLRLDLLENGKVEAFVGDNGAASLTAAVWTKVQIREAVAAQYRLNINSFINANKQAGLFFGPHKNASGSNGITKVTLVERNVYWRNSPKGGDVVNA